MKARGFTLVELMVVVVMIAILAGIVLVSYSNWRQQTAATAVKNDLIAASSAMNNTVTWSISGYPSTIPSSFTPGPDTAVTIVNSTATSYCLKGVSQTMTGITYYISTTNSSPHTGSC